MTTTHAAAEAAFLRDLTTPHPEPPAEVFEPVDEETDRLLHLFGGADIEYRED